MKKGTKLKFSLLLALLMLVLGTTTMFAASKETKLAEKKWQTIKGYDNYETYYKVTVKSDGYITINTQNLKKGEGYNIYLYQNIKGEYKYVGGTYTDKDKDIIKVPVKKGTYYFNGSASSKGKFKFKYTFTKLKTGNNYTPKKATTLAKNKEVVSVYTPENACHKWYKIKLTKNQKLTCFSENTYITVYDKDFQNIDMQYDDNDYSKRVSKTKLAKGTYYICVEEKPEYANGNNNNLKIALTSIKWK